MQDTALERECGRAAQGGCEALSGKEALGVKEACEEAVLEQRSAASRWHWNARGRGLQRATSPIGPSVTHLDVALHRLNALCPLLLLLLLQAGG